ncbi:YjjG family noncanonical pyrimidine nucleotidase [Flavobacteriaceae bacterium]|nr:YjjG family noncanonical pyrimidine nucleotidase [Flavobacteriaceae bacterium]
MINSHKVQHIFFDLDHTLWDFEKNSGATFKSIFEELNFDFSLEVFLDFYNPINHYYWKQYRENMISEIELRYLRLEKTFEAMKVPTSTARIDRISELYIQQLSTYTYLFKDTISVLEYLNSKYTLHIITNGFEHVQQRKLENSGIARFFKTVLTAEKIGVKKPHPTIFLSAMKTAEVLPEHAMMIGDSLEADIQGALKLGMQAIHFNSHKEAYHEECLIIDQLSDLTNLL